MLVDGVFAIDRGRTIVIRYDEKQACIRQACFFMRNNIGNDVGNLLVPAGYCSAISLLLHLFCHHAGSGHRDFSFDIP